MKVGQAIDAVTETRRLGMVFPASFIPLNYAAAGSVACFLLLRSGS